MNRQRIRSKKRGNSRFNARFRHDKYPRATPVLGFNGPSHRAFSLFDNRSSFQGHCHSRQSGKPLFGGLIMDFHFRGNDNHYCFDELEIKKADFNSTLVRMVPAFSCFTTILRLPPFGARTTHSSFTRSAVGVVSVQKLISVCL